ncbi:MAG TPA: glycosyl hydrolase family 79 C-terminal domain-containing protein [Mucilaginibacter sp.]|jgi:hypothetical protein
MTRKWLAILLALCFFSCRKALINPSLPAVNFPEVNNLPAGYYFPVTVTVDQNTPGYKIPSNFEGLSYETGLLTESPEFLNENNKTLIQLIKNLGDGVLRIGGNSSDKTDWTGTTRVPGTDVKSLTTSDIDRLSAFSRAIGWPVMFGLNLAKYDPGIASNEAKYVSNSLKENLYALQFGNEPDVFRLGPRPSKYNYKNYQQEWETYLSAVKKAAPHVGFAGPDVTPFNNDWIKWFATNENKNIMLMDGHYYVTGPASDSSITCSSILTDNPKLTDYLSSLFSESSKYNLPFRISECNSVWGGGKAGVSDRFASSLWALNFMWTVAENKGQGINFHGGDSWFHYSPIGTDNGEFTARPEYYAMLAFKYGATGQTIIPATINKTWFNLSAHACVNSNNTYSITIINKEVTKQFSVKILLNKTASTVQVARLTAPLINSATGVTFAGSSVNADGTFKTAVTEQYTPNQKSFVVTIPAASAAVITIQ